MIVNVLMCFIMVSMLEVAIRMAFQLFIQAKRRNTRPILYYLSTFLAYSRSIFDFTHLFSLYFLTSDVFPLFIDPMLIMHPLATPLGL